MILINTCAVRKKSEDKIDSFLGRLSPLKKDRGRLIAVLGCVAQLRRGELFKKRPEIDIIVGPDHYHELVSLLSRSGKVRSSRRAGIAPGTRSAPPRSSGKTASAPMCRSWKAATIFVPTASFPTAGAGRNAGRGRILAEVLDLAKNGYKEVQLLGQNVNSYRDPKTGDGFRRTSEEVSRVEGIEWIRFITSHPKDLSAEIARTMADRPNICRQLHLPLQSGSTAVLARMNRGYTRGMSTWIKPPSSRV